MTYERIDNSKKFDGKTRESHELRYKIASNFIGNKDIVLDAGCGTGYGLEILKPYLVYIGYDKKSLRGKGTKKHTFIKHDFEKVDPENITGWFMYRWIVDVFVGLEIIEHLNVTGVDAFIRIAKRSNKVIIISTPIIPNSNPYHKQQFTKKRIKELFVDKNWILDHYLEQNKIYGIFIFKRI